MYAVIEAGGKQHKVEPGKSIKIEKVEIETGQPIQFDKVLLVADGSNIKVGAPYVTGGQVMGEVIEHGRAKKIHILKFRRRKHHMKQMGHRQWFTEVKINDIKVG